MAGTTSKTHIQPHAWNLHVAVVHFCLTFQLSCTTNMGNTNISLIRSAQIHQSLSALMPFCIVLFMKLIVPQLTQRFTTIFTEVQHWFQMKPVHDLQSYYLKIHFNNLPTTPKCSEQAPYFRFSSLVLCMHFLSLPCVICPTHLIQLNCITLTHSLIMGTFTCLQ